MLLILLTVSYQRYRGLEVDITIKPMYYIYMYILYTIIYFHTKQLKRESLSSQNFAKYTL